MDPYRNSVKKIFEHLEGAWSLDREVSTKASMSGQALFTKRQDDVLLYREDGKLTLPTGETFKSFRDYRYLFQDDKINVAFQDGRFFHSLNIERQDSQIIATAEHSCGHDFYRAVYTFPDESFDTFRVHWSVNGPRKDYAIDTTYRRQPR